ncbi:PQQ-binding-like beta-propeller repeat protein [Steroidobacter sp. S1-65]|uniref:PQQ-binding-like beta-propeller repeat protein n=1 Tax=Steroidobacter gossypii TaxID=2805490 RepID=A0ABS1X1W1_9GAMM|nr:PQQ-binding-like beta-propeller repeat protein [Steroidobacter gossypii]MBM0107228.1 PQQ-binding-like beta-propeller repeat protein [Steroidobacter gossypii]
MHAKAAHRAVARRAWGLLAAVALSGAQAAMEAPHPGQAVYERSCAACHNQPEATRAPSLDTLKAMRYQTILYALNEGKMKAQASMLSATQKAAVIDFLVGREATSDEWLGHAMCAPERRIPKLDDPATVMGFGFDPKNHRRLSAAQSGLRTADMRTLELAWAMGFPKATQMRSQPAIVGTTLFLPVADAQRLFAIDISAQPCVQWVYWHATPLRTGAAFGELPNGRKVVVFSDIASKVHMLDATTGQALWIQHVGLYPLSLTTGTPALHGDRVYVPISQYEISLGGNDDHECCRTHGAVTALDAMTGKPIWTAHTMEEARPVRDRGDGKMIFGPSGAPIWTSPAIDAKRGVLYVGTGEATSEPAAPTTDAILAIDLKDGRIRWSFQATENDIFLTGCVRNRDGLNCPKNSVHRDVDFGASVIIAQRADGSDVLLAGQKSGTLWALDPDRDGKLVWRQDFGEGSPLGGIHWGIAYDGTRVFAPINRPYASATKAGSQKPGLHAVRVDTGAVEWSYTAKPDCSGKRAELVKACATNIGFSGAPTVIDGAVVSGSLDGFVHAFDAKTGELLFKFDTARAFDTFNGVPASGGAIDNATIVAANGMLFVSSGYGLFGQMPGNVLLAFRPKAKQIPATPSP